MDTEAISEILDAFAFILVTPEFLNERTLDGIKSGLSNLFSRIAHVFLFDWLDSIAGGEVEWTAKFWSLRLLRVPVTLRLRWVPASRPEKDGGTENLRHQLEAEGVAVPRPTPEPNLSRSGYAVTLMIIGFLGWALFLPLSRSLWQWSDMYCSYGQETKLL